MRKSLSAALLLAAACLAADDKPASLEGVIANSATGEPVPRAHVAVTGMIGGKQQSFGATADAAGKFSITALPAGRYFISAERVGFVRSPSERSDVSLSAGEKKEDFRLKLVPGGAVSGRVLDADGEPVERSTVSVSGAYSSSGTVTDENGRFRMGGLLPGKYRIKAEGRRTGTPPEIRSDGTVEQHYAGTWYPSAVTEEAAGRVDVQAGGETGGIDVRLVSAPNVRVSGTVSGMPAGESRATIITRQGFRMQPVGTVKRDGSFEIWGLDAGHYRIWASVGGREGQPMQSPATDIDIGDSNVDNLGFSLVPDLDVSGHVDFLETQQLEPRQQLPPPVVNLVEDDLPALFGGRGAPIAADGSFTLQKVPPARYRISFGGSDPYIKTVRLGTTEIADGVLDFRNGPPAAPLNITARLATGEVSGTLRADNASAGDVRIVMLGNGVRMAGSGSGTFAFRNVPPGKYRLAAVNQEDLRDVIQRQNLDAYKDVVEEFELHDGEKLTRDLKLRRQ